MAAQGPGAVSLKQEGGVDPESTGIQAGADGTLRAGSGAGAAEARVTPWPELDVKPPLDCSDPEVVAGALAARISAAGASVIFEKALTASDVSGGGRVVVPKVSARDQSSVRIVEGPVRANGPTAVRVLLRLRCRPARLSAEVRTRPCRYERQVSWSAVHLLTVQRLVATAAAVEPSWSAPGPLRPAGEAG
jgi:hypothetical protein